MDGGQRTSLAWYRHQTSSHALAFSTLIHCFQQQSCRHAAARPWQVTSVVSDLGPFIYHVLYWLRWDLNVGNTCPGMPLTREAKLCWCQHRSAGLKLVPEPYFQLLLIEELSMRRSLAFILRFWLACCHGQMIAHSPILIAQDTSQACKGPEMRGLLCLTFTRS